jgi:adenylate kinase
MRLSILGPPGAGKGTQAKMIAKEYGLAHVSTGDTLRSAVRNGTPLGKKAEPFMTAGRLVPDEIMVGVLEEFLDSQPEGTGFILDGFPRTLGQARALTEMTKKRGQELDRVLQMALADEVAVERISGRRICSECGREYHVVFRPPKKEGVCDDDGALLVQREDDNETSVRERLSAYHAQDDPLLDYYRRQGLLAEIDAAADVETVFERVRSVLNGRAREADAPAPPRET